MISRSLRISPVKVREIENTWITMPDGIRLAARIWLPEDADDDRFRPFLNIFPYRKRDGTVERDHLTHPYFAGHGYAGVRVDMRGTGDNEGVCLGEYLKQEQDGALAVIEWLAAQLVFRQGRYNRHFMGWRLAFRWRPDVRAALRWCPALLDG